jgi:hypothetical protein
MTRDFDSQVTKCSEISFNGFYKMYIIFSRERKLRLPHFYSK